MKSMQDCKRGKFCPRGLTPILDATVQVSFEGCNEYVGLLLS